MGIGSSGVVNCANTYLGTANYTVADGYVADRTVIVDGNGPAQLNLNFARDEVLDPRITFSRTSNATRVNAQGLIEYAPHNLLTYSEQFDNAAWGTQGLVPTITANSITAPDGTLTADKIVFGAGDSRLVKANISFSAGVTYVVSLYVKPVSTVQNNTIRLAIYDGTNQLNSNDFVLTSANWQRITFTVTSLATSASGTVQIRNALNSSVQNEIYIWGAQLNIDSLQPYYTTSVKNLLGYSQNFENAAWSKSNSSIDATPVMGPLGFLGAVKLIESAVAGQHFVNQGVTVINNSPYTLSCYMKAAERTYCSLEVSMSSSGFEAIVNLSEGTYTSSSYGSSSIPKVVVSNIGAGWYRLAIIGISISTTIATRIKLYQNAITQNYTGDGTSGIYIFGAQLSDSASLDPYSYNFGAAPTSSAYYGPRFDYDPVTLAPKGLLIEEQRINILLNSDTLSTQSVSVTAQAYTLSFYGTGSVALSGAYTDSLVGTGVYPNRVQLTFTPAIGTLTLTVTGSVRYANLEAGSFPTSYIPTTSAQVTRTADNASMVGTNFSSWYNQSEGTVSTEYDVILNTGNRIIFDIGSGGALGTSAYNVQTATYVGLLPGTAPVNMTSTVNTTNLTNKIASGLQNNNSIISVNTVLGPLDTSCAMPASATIMTIGSSYFSSSFGNFLNGHIKSFKFFSKRFINTYLQSLTQ